MLDKHDVPRRVLLIEDDRERATTLAGHLIVAGFEVEMSLDGRMVLETVESFRPEVCLVNLSVPRLDMHEVIRFLRSRFDKLPILANATPFAERQIEDGDIAFDLDFTKPSDPVVVVRQLSAFLHNGFPEVRTEIHNPIKQSKTRMPEYRSPVADLPSILFKK